MTNYEEMCKALGEIILNAEQDKSCHLQLLELLMASVGKICNFTLIGHGYEAKNKTHEKFSNLMVELCAAMLRDYLEVNNDK